MKMIAVIPARHASERLPGKPLKMIGNRPMVQWVYEAVANTGIFDETIVATDHEDIAACVRSFHGKCVMTKPTHMSGTDRVAEVAEQYADADVIANIQGDQPFVSGDAIRALVLPYMEGKRPEMATVACPLKEEDYLNPNVVKVICNLKGEAIYFSRSPIPYYREKLPAPVYAHLGLYAFTRDFLLQYARMKPTPLENCEKLEQLRVLENGYRIIVTQTGKSIMEVNSFEDLEKAQRMYPA